MSGSEDYLLDREKLKDLCSELNKGKRDVIDERLMQVLSCLAEQMCDELVDFSCQYALHRGSDTLGKQDVSFAVQKLFPEVAAEHRVKDLQQQMIDQSVNLQHPIGHQAYLQSTSMQSIGREYGNWGDGGQGTFYNNYSVGASGQLLPGAAQGSFLSGAGASGQNLNFGVGGQLVSYNYRTGLARVQQNQALNSVKESLLEKQRGNFAVSSAQQNSNQVASNPFNGNLLEGNSPSKKDQMGQN